MGFLLIALIPPVAAVLVMWVKPEWPRRKPAAHSCPACTGTATSPYPRRVYMPDHMDNADAVPLSPDERLALNAITTGLDSDRWASRTQRQIDGERRGNSGQRGAS